MKFSEVILAAALLFLAGIVLIGFLFVPFIPLKSFMDIAAGVTGCLLVSIVVGYLFALKIREESRMQAIGSIVLLATTGVLIFLAGWFANPLVNPELKDAMQSMFSTAGWTNNDWAAFTAVVMGLETILFAVVGFIGLYVGSMLRPKKT